MLTYSLRYGVITDSSIRNSKINELKNVINYCTLK